MDVQIEASWKELLQGEFTKEYFSKIVQFLKNEKARGATVYPAGPNIFNAFNSTTVDQVKLVILGQDPYHGSEQAHGLCFSVQKGIKIPPSLKNIYKELHSDIGFEAPEHGYLQAWAEQGVFMLNASLTVEAHKPNSHKDIGWGTFTDAVIKKLSGQKENLVFLLWGRFAQGKQSLIDGSKHLILTAPHPSPFSAHSGFFGCRHFSKANEYLKQKGIDQIKWQL